MAFALLIRHAQNDWVKKNRLAGWTPGVHLNDVGRRQAEQLAGRLSKLPLKALYSSPLERCLETAAPIAGVQGLEIIQLEAVGEVRYGRWQGKKIKKLSKKPAWHIIQHYPSRFRFPEGESLLEVQHRAATAIEELAQKHNKEMFAVVSHADVIKLLLAHYLGMHVDLFQRLMVSPASVSLVALPESGIVRVLRVNDHGPIEAPSSPHDQKKQPKEAAGSETPGEADSVDHEHPQNGSHPPNPTSITETEEVTK